MTEFKTCESPKEKRYCLQFETDNRGYFLRVQTAAAECMDHKPLTNFERIKAMTVEEMAKLLAEIGYDGCTFCPAKVLCEEMVLSCENIIKLWLESEVQEE